MQKFWYHSPVRFYRSIEELEDMTNPQNTQYFGHKSAYPLEINSYHRFLIPNYQNEFETEDFELWIVGSQEMQIPCQFGIFENKLIRVTFISYEFLEGHLEIRTPEGTVYYSNCVKFIDSTDDEGRKYIRIATKHNYNRNLFTFLGSDHDWMITNLPGYCLGTFDIDEDVELQKSGEMASSMITGSWSEENVSYEIHANGDNNILSFIAVHSTNNDFYIDGTKRTRKEKPEYEEFTPTVTMKFSNQKDENGMNIILNEDDVFGDAFRYVLGNEEKTAIYTYNNNEYAIPTEYE